MHNEQPIVDPATLYRMEVRGRADVVWLQNFESSVEAIGYETRQMEDITVLNLHTDQSEIDGLGVTILQLHFR